MNDFFEEERHRSEVRQWIKIVQLKGWSFVLDCFKRPEIQSRVKKIQADMRDQINKGNKGEWGDWRD